ncbi:MAG: glycosyltransferase family 2 protein [Gammaproteobacteria bacterium]|nr:glycosyltransferase family 2 protein [Gammaproteobacteria bacterium]MBU6508781.1 glycosyltransferase family 2 protein [Gammaproteobacteria bacterium]
MSFKACAVIPVFNHHTSLEAIVVALLANRLPVILVDDGSDAKTKQVLADLAARNPQVECLTLARNRGKGVAAMTGMVRAGERGFTHALHVDADGQHNLADIPALLALARQNPQQLISGLPRYDASVPRVRYYGRYLTHALVWLHSLSFTLRDSMCGFRVYPVAPSLALAAQVRIGARMDFDTDIMTRLYWAGTESLFLPTRVRYPADGLSHFRMLRDNLRMAWLHLRLFLGMLPRAPGLLRRNRARRRARHWARIGERGSLGGLRFLGNLDRVLGRRLTLAVLYPVTAYFLATHARARRASREFLTAAGAAASPVRSFRHFLNFAVCILDKVAAWQDPLRVQVDFSGQPQLAAALSAGRGALLLSAHLGNLELARALGTRMAGLHVNALVYSGNARKLDQALTDTSDAYRMRLLEVDRIGPDTALLLREKIAAGEVVVTVGDRTSLAPDSPVVRVPFLGRPARFAMGPYVLAHVLECPVYLLFCLRQGSAYRIFLEPFAERIRLPRDGREAAVQVWAGRYAARLADYAGRFPLQWYNFYDFWADGASPPASVPGNRNHKNVHARPGKLPV